MLDQTFDPTAAEQFLGGYLSAFKLRANVTRYTGRGAFILPALIRFWERPGVPAVPLAELQRHEVGRINFIIRECFATASRRDELDAITFLRGRERAELLRRIGAGGTR